MSTYKNLIGKEIKFLNTNPDNDAAEGQIWYNATGEFKNVIVSEAWSSGSLMIRNTSTAGANHALGAGIQTAAIYAGGYSPYTNKTEHYNGTGWSTGGNMNLTRITTGFGTETAAVAAGGITFPGVVGGQVEEYDGSSWTTGNALGTARPYGSGSGTLTAGLYAGGSPNASAATSVANSEEYNGTNWSEGNDLNTARRFLGSAATAPQTAALVFGGDNAPAPGTVRSFTETYDGTSWTEVGDLNTARRNMGGAGDFTSALAFGGSLGPPGNSTATESWDGSSWSTSPASLANARDSQPSIGTSTAALFVGGPNPTFPGGWVEEYNKSINTFTAAAWASGGALPAVNNGLTGAGTPTATIGMGSRTPGQDQASYEYDGSSWSSGGSLGTPMGNSGGAGTQTAALIFGGGPGGASSTTSRKYDGTSWTATNAMNNTTGLCSGIGTSQTAALVNGGFSPSAVVNTSEEFDGTNWTNSGTMNQARMGCSGAGIQTAGVTFGGLNYPASTAYANSEEYNGSTWSNGNTMITARNMYSGGDGASETAAYAIAGDSPSNPDSNLVEGYDGTTWSTRPSLATGRRSGAAGSGATSTSAIFFGGRDGGSDQSITEEFTGETSALNIKTITTS